MNEARRPAAQQMQQQSVFDELAKLAALGDQGIVTEQEFQEQKRKLLGTQLRIKVIENFIHRQVAVCKARSA